MFEIDMLCGHIYHEESSERFNASLPSFGDVAAVIKDSGVGQTRLLYEAVRQVLGKDFAEIQTIGDCVPHSYQRAWITLACVRIVINGLAEQLANTPDNIPATEFWYALSRVEIGRGIFNGGDGASGSMTCEAMLKYGTLFRRPYGSIDLTTYSGSRARQWGDKRYGCPDVLEPLGKDFTVNSTVLTDSYAKARDLIYSGRPVAVSSNYGFVSGRRDPEGFIKPNGSWSHCMLFTAVDDNPHRPGLLCDNRSWPTSLVSGPKGEHDIPDGTWWVDAEYADAMLAGRWGRNRPQPDSYALSDMNGFPAQLLDML
jgi:hypothetical protein